MHLHIAAVALLEHFEIFIELNSETDRVIRFDKAGKNKKSANKQTADMRQPRKAREKSIEINNDHQQRKHDPEPHSAEAGRTKEEEQSGEPEGGDEAEKTTF
jgi:hypothetical protein